MNPKQDQTLRAGEIRWLIEQENLEVSPLSPLAFAMQTKPQGNLRQFRERGVIGSEWQAALSVLAQPFHQVRALTPGERNCRIAKFYAGAETAAGELIGCWFEG